MPSHSTNPARKSRARQAAKKCQEPRHEAEPKLETEPSPSTIVEQSQDKDIFIEVDPSSPVTLTVTEEAQKSQQVVDDESPQEKVEVIVDQSRPIHLVEISDSDSDEEVVLPETITRLSAPNGAEVYLVGTAHFSLKSVEDVRKVIRAVKPGSVILELCSERAFMLAMDEATLLEENKNLTFSKIRSTISELGFAQGLISIMLIEISARFTRKLGVAPGAELRSGVIEARKIPGCSIVYGDRSLRVTIARAVASLTFWQKIKFVFNTLVSNFSITQEDVENCKDKDILEKLIQELRIEFPGLKSVLIDERNIYLAHSIYSWACFYESSTGPLKIVAIVGMGHVAGIVEHWGKTTNAQMEALKKVPETSKTKRYVSKTIKYGSLALLIYLGVRATGIQGVLQRRLGQIGSF